MIKRILSLRIILPTQCFVVAVWELEISLNEMLVSRRAFISSFPGDADEARRGKEGWKEGCGAEGGLGGDRGEVAAKNIFKRTSPINFCSRP